MAQIEREAAHSAAPRDFHAALAGAPPMRLIAEVKKAIRPRASSELTLTQLPSPPSTKWPAPRR